MFILSAIEDMELDTKNTIAPPMEKTLSIAETQAITDTARNLLMIISKLVTGRTAVCMCTCVFAKSFKEANNYATPVMLIFMFGSYVTMIPDMELTAQTAAIPIVNVALLVEGLFQFSYKNSFFPSAFMYHAYTRGQSRIIPCWMATPAKPHFIWA